MAAELATPVVDSSSILTGSDADGLAKLLSDSLLPGQRVTLQRLHTQTGAASLSYHSSGHNVPQFLSDGGACRNKTNTVLLIQTADNHKFGAYTKTYPWGTMSDNYHNDPSAFLFSLNQPGTVAPWKTTNNGGGTNAVYYGQPTYIGFGASRDLKLNFGQLNYSQPTVSTKPHTFSGTYQLKASNTQVTCYEIFQVVIVNVPVRPSGFLSTPFINVPFSFSRQSCDAMKRQLLQPAAVVPSSADSLSDWDQKSKKIYMLNIIVLGGSGAGKSSFMNSCVSIFAGRIKMVQTARGSERSVTRTLTHVALTADGSSVPLVLWDTMGWEPESYRSGQLNYMLDGNLPNKFDLDRMPYNKQPNFVTHPTIHERAHAACILIPAPLADDSKYIQRVVDFRIACDERDMVPLILLTKIDQLEPKLESNGFNMTYHSVLIREAIDTVSKKTGIHRNHIFPIKNYESERQLNPMVDALLFDALTNLRNSAEDYLTSRA